MSQRKVRAEEMISKMQWTMLKKVWISKLLKDHPKVIQFLFYNKSSISTLASTKWSSLKTSKFPFEIDMP